MPELVAVFCCCRCCCGMLQLGFVHASLFPCGPLRLLARLGAGFGFGSQAAFGQPEKKLKKTLKLEKFIKIPSEQRKSYKKKILNERKEAAAEQQREGEGRGNGAQPTHVFTPTHKKPSQTEPKSELSLSEQPPYMQISHMWLPLALLSPSLSLPLSLPLSLFWFTYAKSNYSNSIIVNFIYY